MVRDVDMVHGTDTNSAIHNLSRKQCACYLWSPFLHHMPHNDHRLLCALHHKELWHRQLLFNLQQPNKNPNVKQHLVKSKILLCDPIHLKNPIRNTFRTCIFIHLPQHHSHRNSPSHNRSYCYLQALQAQKHRHATITIKGKKVQYSTTIKGKH